MASKMTNISSVTDAGREKWKIALLIGTPIALGVAGLWYYWRCKAGGADKPDREIDKEISETKSGDTFREHDAEQNDLKKAQELKNIGNKNFKEGKYDTAIEYYTKAIQICPRGSPGMPEHNMEMATFYQNRAAAYEQLRNPQQVIDDCTSALLLNKHYIKAFVRRVKAYEMTGRLFEALKDITAVCILESFAQPQSLSIADRVLKLVGKTKAREAYKRKQPEMPSRQFIRTYFEAFANDPIIRWTPPQSSEKTDDKSFNDSGEDKNADDMFNEGIRIEDALNDSSEDKTSRSFINPDISLSQELPPSLDPGPFHRAHDALMKGEYDTIIDLCTRELEVDDSPNRALALLLRATFSLLQGLGEWAKRDLAQILSLEGLKDKKVRVNALIKRGSLLMNEEKQTEALDDFATAVRADPENCDVYHHRGQQNLLLDRVEEAQRDFEKSIQLNPSFAISYVQKCYAEYRQALLAQSPLQLQSAVRNFEKVVEKFPDSADGHMLYAQTLCDQMQYQMADDEFRKALAINPDNANTIVHRALLWLQWKQETTESIKMINQALEVDDKCEFAYETLGTIEVQKGNIDKANKLFERALSLSKSESEMAHLFSLQSAALAQTQVADELGLRFPVGV